VVGCANYYVYARHGTRLGSRGVGRGWGERGRLAGFDNVTQVWYNRDKVVELPCKP